MLRRLIDSPWTYFAAAALLLLVGIATQFEIVPPSQEEGDPEDIARLREQGDVNVVFILIDTLRADRLGAYGYERDTSTIIDGIARHGLRFDNVISQSSWTKASMASLWTGTLPANNGIVRYNDVIPAEARMPAEIFREAGYRTAGIFRNGWVAPNFGFDQGFDFYLKPEPGKERQREAASHPSRPSAIPGTDEDLIVSAVDFLENFGREKFFLYLHFMDVHQYVYDQGAENFGTSYSDVYDQSIHWADRLVGYLLKKLGELDLRRNTMIVIASDHGEAFLEHGFEGHARNLYGEVIRVPFIVGLPFHLDEGIVVEEPVSNTDIWPTILDLAGLPPLTGADGRSLVPNVLRAAGVTEEAQPPAPTIAHLDRRWGTPDESDPIVAVIDGRVKLVWSVNQPKNSELFDLAADPLEQENLWASHPERARLEALARDYIEGAESPWGAEPIRVELDELRLNQLRALGYMIR